MAKKRKPIVMYFYAPEWDRNASEKKDKVLKACKELGLSCNVIDVETQNGVYSSIKYGVRNVPTAVIINEGEVIGVEKGNYIQDFLVNYC
jgi:hypothetical protein